jgi:hypothetical protein
MQEKKAIVTHIMANWLRLEVPVAAIPGTYPKNLLSEGAGSQSTAGRNSPGAVACINKAHKRPWVAVISLIRCGTPRYQLAVLTVFMHAQDRGVPA